MSPARGLRIAMADYRPEDRAFLIRLSEQPSIRRLTGLPAGGDAAAWDRYIAERHNETGRILVMRQAAEPAGSADPEVAPLGVFYLINLGAPELYQVGYCVDEAARGRGVATQAVAAVAASLFAGGRCVRIQATVEPPNRASQRVLEKCGFQREGLMRQGVKIGDALVDAYLYSRLRSDEQGRAQDQE